jgi:hypothetical protein
MYYNLNFNYGKVALTGNEEQRVAVYNSHGKIEHLLFSGCVNTVDTSTGYLTSFFGSSGFKINPDDGWTFCEGLLVCFVQQSSCYAVMKDNEPFDCKPTDYLYKKLKLIIALGGKQPKSNVFRLR